LNRKDSHRGHLRRGQRTRGSHCGQIISLPFILVMSFARRAARSTVSSYYVRKPRLPGGAYS